MEILTSSLFCNLSRFHIFFLYLFETVNFWIFKVCTAEQQAYKMLSTQCCSLKLNILDKGLVAPL